MPFPSFSFLQTENMFAWTPISNAKRTGPHVPLVLCGSLPDPATISSKVVVGVTDSGTSYSLPALRGALHPCGGDTHASGKGDLPEPSPVWGQWLELEDTKTYSFLTMLGNFSIPAVLLLPFTPTTYCWLKITDFRPRYFQVKTGKQVNKFAQGYCDLISGVTDRAVRPPPLSLLFNPGY